MYFAEARFYDAGNRQWLSMDPVKDGLNWYLYCGANPTTYWDPTGFKFNLLSGSGAGSTNGLLDYLIGGLSFQRLLQRIVAATFIAATIPTLPIKRQLETAVQALGNAAWFVIGVVTPAVENKINVAKSIVNILTRPFVRSGAYGIESITPGITDRVAPRYDVLDSYQNTFNDGRFIGNIVTIMNAIYR